MDEEKRTDYDSLIGFSRLAINPFLDSTFEADQVKPKRNHSESIACVYVYLPHACTSFLRIRTILGSDSMPLCYRWKENSILYARNFQEQWDL